MKNFLKFVPVQLTIFLVVGILASHFFYVELFKLITILSVLVVLFFTVYMYVNKQFAPSVLFTAITFLITFFIGVSTNTFNNSQNQQMYYGNQSKFSIEQPQKAIISIQKVLKPTIYSTKYEAVVLELNAKKVTGKILVNIKNDSLQSLLEVDDTFFVNIDFSEIQETKNPYSFNYKAYLKNKQIYYQIYLDRFQFLSLKKFKPTLKGIAATIRKKINIALVKNGFKNNELAVINALLLGQRQHISEDLMQSYAGAGAIHILAVSGLHVGIILLILTFLFKPLHYFKHGKLIASICIVLSLWIFAIIAGLSASVVRAVTMFTAITIGMYSNRETNIYNTLIISMFFLLLIHPNYLFEVGFQLSYLAVFAIVWIQPKINTLWKPKNWFIRKIWQLFTVSLAAQIGVLPLSLYYFHQFPGLFFLSNLVIIPFLGIILISGVMVIALALLGSLSQFMADLYSIVIQAMNSFVAWVSNQQLFIIQNITFSFELLLTWYIFVFFIFKWTEKRNFTRTVFVMLSIITIQSVYIFEKHRLQTTQNLLIFNRSKKSVVGKRLGNNIEIYGAENKISIAENPLKNYLVGTGISNKVVFNPSKNIVDFENQVILVVDSLGVYKFNFLEPSIIVLRQSPKINLERLLKIQQAKIVIADGSNYKSYVSKWKETCNKMKIPFYNTMQNGAFILNNKNKLLSYTVH